MSEYQFLLMGDSQIQRLNGELISKKTKNIASSGEHYYFTYQKLLTLIENKKHKIDKLILGVSVHNFAPVYNRLFNIDFSEGRSSLERYLYFIRPFDNSNFITSFDGLFKSVFLGIYSTPDWGGFKESTNSNPNIEIINTTFNMHFSIKQNEEKFSYSQRTYLSKIDSLCINNNIDLILISTPYHFRYKEKIDPKYFDFFSESLRKLNHRYHLNFITDKIDPIFMSDANHLNKLGAKKYSKIIEKKLNARTHNKKTEITSKQTLH
ncbi:hypothetical protein [Tenacibaculum ovolyticum]|uniref:hypothetical protein n=1 Tax=Tenacibaculum ovolyticum TaxID=104270 RepID=UPI003BA9AD70